MANDEPFYFLENITEQIVIENDNTEPSSDEEKSEIEVYICGRFWSGYDCVPAEYISD